MLVDTGGAEASLLVSGLSALAAAPAAKEEGTGVASSYAF